MSFGDTEKDTDNKIASSLGEVNLSHDETPVIAGFSLNPGAKINRRESTGSESSWTEKLLNSLKFRNPGPQLKDFNPDTSRREMRKLKRLDQNEASNRRRQRQRKKNQKQNFHDRSGIRMSDGRDVCDCQDTDCPGCHFPCAACGSEKCGVECRCDRKWTYLKDIEIENPLPSDSRRLDNQQTN